jgi:GGDEF domain-containing protein
LRWSACASWAGPAAGWQPLTASIGLAERLADKCNARRQLVELADARMYRAKQLGRNQVVSR